MQSIVFYLQKYSNLGFKESKIKNLLIESIKEVCNLEIDDTQIKILDNSIKISAIGAPKSEIFINKEKISEIFKQKMSDEGYREGGRPIR